MHREAPENVFNRVLLFSVGSRFVLVSLQRKTSNVRKALERLSGARKKIKKYSKQFSYVSARCVLGVIWMHAICYGNLFTQIRGPFESTKSINDLLVANVVRRVRFMFENVNHAQFVEN